MLDVMAYLEPYINAGKKVLDILLPPQCLACGSLVEGQGLLCPSCWDGIDFLGDPCCGICGSPFEFEAFAGALCGACMREPPPYRRARSVFAYDKNSSKLILAFKHGDRTDAAPAYGRWLARAGAELIGEADVIVPVPLHWMRLFRRKYNQAALLAGALGRLVDRPVAPDLLVRRRRTPTQGRLSPSARRKNVAGAFALKSSGKAAVSGKRVLLIDDVLTTGATAAACAKVLLKGGAARVDVLTLARVVAPKR